MAAVVVVEGDGAPAEGLGAAAPLAAEVAAAVAATPAVDGGAVVAVAPSLSLRPLGTDMMAGLPPMHATPFRITYLGETGGGGN